MRVENQPHLIKDPTTGAILNTNSAEIQKARIRKNKRKNEAQEIKELKSEMKEIKELLHQLLGKNHG